MCDQKILFTGSDSSVDSKSRGCEFIPAQPHTFMEIYHEIMFTIILLLLIPEGLLSETSESMCTKYWLTA